MYDLPVFIRVLAVVTALGMPAMLGLALYRGARALTRTEAFVFAANQ